MPSDVLLNSSSNFPRVHSQPLTPEKKCEILISHESHDQFESSPKSLVSQQRLFPASMLNRVSQGISIWAYGKDETNITTEDLRQRFEVMNQIARMQQVGGDLQLIDLLDLTLLPPSIVVSGDLMLKNCLALKKIPENWTVKGNIILQSGVYIQEIPKDLNLWGHIKLNHCDVSNTLLESIFSLGRCSDGQKRQVFIKCHGMPTHIFKYVFENNFEDTMFYLEFFADLTDVRNFWEEILKGYSFKDKFFIGFNLNQPINPCLQTFLMCLLDTRYFRNKKLQVYLASRVVKIIDCLKTGVINDKLLTIIEKSLKGFMQEQVSVNKVNDEIRLKQCRENIVIKVMKELEKEIFQYEISKGQNRRIQYLKKDKL